MLKMFQMEDSKPVGTPMVTRCKLSKDDNSPDVDQSSYQSMIGSLLYITTSRLDIMHVVGMVGRYQAAPKQSHLQAVKKDIQVFKRNNGLWSLVSQKSKSSVDCLFRCRLGKLC
jgi:hypothetical protein